MTFVYTIGDVLALAVLVLLVVLYVVCLWLVRNR